MMSKVWSRIFPGNKDIGSRSNISLIYFQRIIVMVFIILILLYFLPIKVLLAREIKTNKYIKSWKIKEDESFTIEYIHSVQLTPVSETYIVKKDKIILIESYFNSYGAGLPATTPYKFQITGKGFRIYEINEIMEYLIYRTGAERANHKLILGGREYVFLDFTEPRSGVEFNVKKMGVLTYIVREVF